MKRIIIVIALLCTSLSAYAQHSLQVDDGAGNIGIITGPTSGGISMFTLPSTPGTLITTGTTATNPWLLQGNALSALGASPTQWFGTSTNDDVIMKAFGAEKLRLVSGGGVVIPGSALSINGIAYTFPAAAPNGVLTNTGGVLSWAAGGGSGWSLTGNGALTDAVDNFLGTTSAVPIRFVTNGTGNLRMLIESGGNIAIGAAAASTRLDVISNGTAPTVRVYSGSNQVFSGAGFSTGGLALHSSQVVGVGAVSSIASLPYSLGNYPSHLSFLTAANGASVPTERVRIDNAGNVIVNTGHLNLNNSDNSAREMRFSEPSGSGVNYTAFKAQAQGGNVTYTLPNDGGTNGQVLSTSGGVTPTLSWIAPGGGSGWALNGNVLTGTLPASPTEFFGSTNGADVVMKTNGVEQMRLRSAGGISIPNTTGGGVGVIYQGGAHLMHNYGTNNFFAGTNAGNLTMTGTDNAALGFQALGNNTTGSYNTATGTNALISNTTGSANTASGASALNTNTTGSINTASGINALFSNTTGSNNTASGGSALFSNTTGFNNTASGREALYSNTTGNNNTATGLQALRANTTGGSNTASGVNALFSNTTGDNNTASGASALLSNTTGVNNTASGYQALYSNTTGNNNTASGLNALFSNTKGISNIASGVNSLYSNTTASQNIAIGHSALYTQSFANGGVAWNSNNTAVGFEALYSNQPTSTGNGIYNTATGYQALRANTTGFNNTASGASALSANTTGVNNTALGSFALWSNTTASGNTALGSSTLQVNTTGSDNTASGISALGANTTGSNNTASGKSAMQDNTTASQNVAIGNLALLLQSYSNGGVAWNSNNTAVGYEALRNNQPTSTSNGINNTATGYQALRSNTTGAQNTASGFQALFSNTTGGGNTASGVNALFSNTTGFNNTCIGYSANVSSVALSNATAIGANATVDASNKIQLGDGSVTLVNTSGAIMTPELRGAAANKYAEQHTVTAGEIAGNTATIPNSIVAGATTVVVASLVSGPGGHVTTASTTAGNVVITFNVAPTNATVVNYIIVNP